MYCTTLRYYQLFMKLVIHKAPKINISLKLKELNMMEMYK